MSYSNISKKNFVWLSIGRDLAVMMKALVSSVAIVYFIIPSNAANCDTLEFSLDFSYFQDILGPVRASSNVQGDRTCQQNVHSVLFNISNAYQQLDQASVYHQICKPTVDSMTIVHGFGFLALCNQLLFVFAILFKMSVVHNKGYECLRPFFLRRGRVLYLVLSVAASLVACGKVGAVFWVA